MTKADIRKQIDKEQKSLDYFVPPREQSPNLIDLEGQRLEIESIEFADFTARDGGIGKLARVKLVDSDEEYITFSKVVTDQLSKIALELESYTCVCTIARIKNYHSLQQWEEEG